MRLRDDTGMSLTELLVVTVLMGVILATSYMLLNTATVMADQSEARAIAADEAQQTIERMTREIKQAQEVKDGKGALCSTQPDSIQLYMDENMDGSPEKIRYYRSGTTIFRQLAPVTSALPLTHGAYGTPEVVLEDLSPTQGNVFCYHSTAPDTAVTCANGSKHGYEVVPNSTDPENSPPVVSMVGIDLRNQHSTGQQTATVVTSVIVRIRAVENVVK